MGIDIFKNYNPIKQYLIILYLLKVPIQVRKVFTSQSTWESILSCLFVC